MPDKVLLVDNSVPLSRSIEFTLSQNRYKVDVVRDETKAAEVLLSREYDIVIVNLRDTHVYGENILKFLQGKSSDQFPPVLALTTPEGEISNDSTSTRGITGWLAIPFSNEKLLNSLKKIHC